MSRIYVPSSSPDSWKALLAQPERHWKVGRSARTAAYAWESGATLPPEISAVLRPVIGQAELLLAIPEHKVPLPGGSRDSQSDVFALIRGETQTVACTVEAKVDEPFGPTLGEWLGENSPGKAERLSAILSRLEITDPPLSIRYQLLHRTAAAVIESERFMTGSAAMIVHSFSPEHCWFEDFAAFTKLFQCEAELGSTLTVNLGSGKPLYLAWAAGDQRFREM